jgi:hypothetical protein
MMMPSESQELLVYVDELIKGTRDNVFQWKPVNPTTYFWEKTTIAGGGGRITLQRVEQNVQSVVAGRVAVSRRVFCILTAFEIRTGGVAVQKLSVSGAVDPALNKKLQELFDLIASGFSQQGLEFLKTLLFPPSKS